MNECARRACARHARPHVWMNARGGRAQDAALLHEEGAPCTRVSACDVSFVREPGVIARALAAGGGSSESPGALLAGFFEYYGTQFRFRDAVVTIRGGPGRGELRKRAAFARPRFWSLSVEDPFENGRDLGRVLSRGGVAAIAEEFARAVTLLRGGGGSPRGVRVLDALCEPVPAATVAARGLRHIDELECFACGGAGHMAASCPLSVTVDAGGRVGVVLGHRGATVGAMRARHPRVHIHVDVAAGSVRVSPMGRGGGDASDEEGAAAAPRGVPGDEVAAAAADVQMLLRSGMDDRRLGADGARRGGSSGRGAAGGRRVCAFHLRGRCKFGDRCRDTHPGREPSREAVGGGSVAESGDDDGAAAQ